ncbi:MULTISPECIES: DUF6037 family protein [Vibrio]|uniref:DUF6037 family protein n=1 Tax=Vibrio TaxID=662 RepID=UPI00188B3CF0|nr:MULTISPECIES: DUF6037 family protein [Vibrio]EKO3828805.1 hypothetical protein [Vibrio harveyi]MCR9980814.1 DUF6037 family protein [Vibrio alginolyticus]HCE3221119.1 hypothetical protein [Vibrio parahaemolyticus]ELY5146037.1 hypothetical protein [Vibrio vulnificus]MBF4453679.1 hypothetical protein [Vibrio vulnificus]
MKMTALQDLHRSMMKIGTDMQQFQVNTGSASFDCLFSVREAPFILALTSRGSAPKFFKFEVQNGYWIKPYFDGFFYDLVDVLSSGAKSGVRLNPKDFLEQLNNSIPTQAKPQSTPSPKQIITLRPDITEDRDRPYFDTWIYWKSADRQGPREENRHKTLMILGKAALEYSIAMKASSKWSAVDLDKSWDDNI